MSFQENVNWYCRIKDTFFREAHSFRVNKLMKRVKFMNKFNKQEISTLSFWSN